jgi:hypothetical protein
VEPTPLHPLEAAAYARKVAIARRVVLSLAAVVGLTLVGALVLGLYHHVTERPAKELFGFDGKN